MPKRSRKESNIEQQIEQSKSKKTKTNNKSTTNKDTDVDLKDLPGNGSSHNQDGHKVEDSKTSQDYDCKRLSSTGQKYNLKIFSWNVSGIRACLKKNGLDAIKKEKADVVCLQETKCSDKNIPDEMKTWSEYPFKYWSPADKNGYSGVCLFSKVKPIVVDYGIGIKEHDSEGRVITAEFDNYYLVTAYVPNSGRGLVRLDYRMKWDRDFSEYLKRLDEKKAVIVCGDLNVSHKEIDLENPKTNTKTAGFTKEERDNFTKLLEQGFIDSFRELYPNSKKAYTFWSYMRNARQKDIGWRLDYFVISKQLNEKLCDNQIRSKVMGSDHCPIVLYVAL